MALLTHLFHRAPVTRTAAPLGLMSICPLVTLWVTRAMGLGLLFFFRLMLMAFPKELVP